MNRWDSLFVNEMTHSYQRYLKQGNTEKFVKVLRDGLGSTSIFARAFTAGVITWLADKEFDMTNEIDIKACTLDEPSFPTMYEHPCANSKELENALPEFQKFGVTITNFG